MNTAHYRSSLVHPRYRPDIDGLRAIAVLSVVAFHFFPNHLPSGFIGVDIFFVISGFLISNIIFQNLDKGTFRFTEFYARRIRRIFPALIVVLISCLIVGWLSLLPDELNLLGKHIAAGASFISNLVLWNEAGYFDTSAESKPLLHLWSLGIEEQFYIIWPLLLWITYKKHLNLFTLSIIITGASFLLNIESIHHDPIATFYSPQTRFWELLCGSLLAYGTLYWQDVYNRFLPYINWFLTNVFYRKESPEKNASLPDLLASLGCVIIIYGLLKINKDLGFPGKYALIPVIGTMCIIVAGPNAWINRKILSNKYIVWFGLISFPLYLWHWPLITFTRIINNGDPSSRDRNIALISSFVLAWLTVKLIEQPFRFGKTYPKQKVIFLSVLMIITCFLGGYIYQSNHSKTHQYQNLPIKRHGFEHMIGNSFRWFEGKDNWLFLGNHFNNTIAKLKVATTPSKELIEQTIKPFLDITTVATQYGIKVVFVLGPNKSTIYPEYLPQGLTPSSQRYVNFFLDELRKTPNLIVYDPSEYLLAKKKTEGILYWRTDTHWNTKGAYLVYDSLTKLLNLPTPKVKFKQISEPHRGDLVDISGQTHFPITSGDDWSYTWETPPAWIETKIPGKELTSFGYTMRVNNPSSLSKDKVWVIGDSFSRSLRPLINATFTQTVYKGHWKNIPSITNELKQSKEKPDLILIIRVERSF